MAMLTDIEKDAFSEIFNIGVGHAAAALSEMIGQEILLEIPEVVILNRRELIELFSFCNGDIARVSESFSGKFQGEALLLFPDQSSLELVRLLLNEDVPLERLSEMEQEALSEVGNIILTGCLASIADIIQEEIPTGLPVYSQGNIQSILDDHHRNKASLLFLKTLFTVQDKKIHGYVSLLMDLATLDQFKAKLLDVLGLTEGS